MDDKPEKAPKAPLSDLEAMLAAVEADQDEPMPKQAEPPDPDERIPPRVTSTASEPTLTGAPWHALPSQAWEPPYPNWAIDRTDSRQTPLPDFACMTCPAAVWLTGKGKLLCYCTVMRVETWSTENPQQIQVCTAKEMAIIARIEAEAGEAEG